MQIVVKVNKKAAELSSAAKYFMERETRFELATRGLGTGVFKGALSGSTSYSQAILAWASRGPQAALFRGKKGYVGTTLVPTKANKYF